MTTVNRSTYGLPNGPPAHSTLKPAQVEISSNRRRVSQQPAIVPPQPSAFHHAGPRAPNFSIVITSPPKLSVTKALVFDLTESDEEPASKTLKTSLSRSERPQRTPARSVPDVPTSKPKRDVMAMETPTSGPATESVQKKRGRPPNTSETPATGNSSKKRGRKPKLPEPKIKIQIPRPIYHKFICEWKGCLAELHNLETLRNHVFRAHKHKLPLGNRQCLWGKCSSTHHAHDKETQSPRVLDTAAVEFKTKAEWQDHINSAHLVPIAWSMGDGPKVAPLGTINTPEPKALPRWLCDENGNQVTPWVEGQPIEDGDPYEQNSNRFALNRAGMYVIYEPVMNSSLYWKMPNEPSYFILDGKTKSKKS